MDLIAEIRRRLGMELSAGALDIVVTICLIIGIIALIWGLYSIITIKKEYNKSVNQRKLDQLKKENELAMTEFRKILNETKPIEEKPCQENL